MTKVYELHVELLEVEPLIWRKIAVPAEISLMELHAILQGAMGWEDCHLHSFLINGTNYELPDPDGYGGENAPKDERQFTLKDCLKEGDDFIYIYDYGDMWRHSIKVEQVTDVGNVKVEAQCTAGERACPPEDTGGAPGFENLLTILADKSHPEYEFHRNWAKHFDPTAFSVTQANSLIRAITEIYRSR